MLTICAESVSVELVSATAVHKMHNPSDLLALAEFIQVMAAVDGINFYCA